jgi:hypothetical protein
VAGLVPLQVSVCVFLPFLGLGVLFFGFALQAVRPREVEGAAFFVKLKPEG